VKDSYNVDMLTQVLAMAALQDGEYMRMNAYRIRQTRDRVSGELNRLGCTVLPSAANFLFVRSPLPGRQMLQELRSRGVLVRHFPQPRIDPFVRVTVGTDEEMDCFLSALADVLR